MIVRVRGFVGTAHGARTARRFVVAALVAFALVLQALPGISGTTGSLNGVLHDAAGKPISGATVTASSPSQRSKTTTDGHGNWGFASLAPDTYTVTFEKAGYATSSQPGVTIQADNSLVLNGELSPSNLQTIGRAASRSSGSLLRPGQTASLYSVSSSEATAAAALGGGGNNNSALSAISSLPGVSVPLTQSGWGQSIFIRGGNYTQTANEVDGVPINRAFDQYPASALSSLGNQEIEVYTGDAPSDSQATGLAGLVNQVIKTGTYPGTLSGDYGVGTPSQYHHFNVEVSGATQNGNLSWYLASGGYQQDTRVVSQFNGAGFLQATGNGSIYNYVSANCGTANPTVGCYQNASPFLGGIPFGPNGYSIADVLFGGEPSTYDRETIANLHFGIPHKDGTKDDVQYLYDYGLTRNYPNSSFASWGPALSDVENGTANGVPYLGTCGAPGPATTCDGPVQPTYIDANQYTGKLGVPFTANEVGNAVNLKFPGQLVSGLGANVPDTQYDGEISEFAINKFQYQHNIGTQGYVRAYAYTMYSNRIDNGIVGLWQTYVGSFSSDYAIQSHTSGYVVNGGFQIDPKNFVKFDAGFTTSNAYRLNNLTDAGSGETQVAYLVNSLNPTSGCYSGTGAYVSCSSGQAGYVLAPVNALTGGCGQALCLTKGSPVAGTESSITCGTGPCQYYAVNSGLNASYNTVTPKFLNASIGDSWKPIPQLTVDATLRTDTFSYVMQDTDTFGNQLFVNDYNALHCISGTTITTIAYGASCPAGSSPTNLSAISPNLTFANYLQPRFGISWQKDPNDVFRVSYGRFVQPPDTAAVQATNVQASVPSTSFYSEFGFNSFARTVVPEISYNLDASWQHGFGGGITTVVTPFLRKTQDEFASIVVDPKTNFVADVNGENLDARGIEFALNKGDFDKNGLALRASFTYTYATAQFKQYATGGSFVSDINTQIVNYNKYTSYCILRKQSEQQIVQRSKRLVDRCVGLLSQWFARCVFDRGSRGESVLRCEPTGPLRPRRKLCAI